MCKMNIHQFTIYEIIYNKLIEYTDKEHIYKCIETRTTLKTEDGPEKGLKHAAENSLIKEISTVTTIKSYIYNKVTVSQEC